VLGLTWPPETALRALLTGGDVLHRAPPPGLPFALVNNYGPTEATVVTTSADVAPVDAPLKAEPPSIGYAIDGVLVHLLDRDMNPVSDGDIGEIFIGGSGLARGYLNRPALTANYFVPDPSSAQGARMYRTGDLARRLPDGSLAFIGRSDQQIKIRGHRIELGEVEAVLEGHPAVCSAAVVSNIDANGDVRLIAYVVAASGRDLADSELREYLRDELPDQMVPTTFARLVELPITVNGKVDRGALPHPSTLQVAPDDASEGPRTSVEEHVAGIVAELLRVDRIGRDENIFLRGGHSLLAAQVIDRIQRDFGVDLPLRAVFEEATVAGLCAQIERLIISHVDALSDDEVRRILT
jgi:acyl carrier protein